MISGYNPIQIVMDLLSIAAVAMRNDQERANAVSQNIANVLTPGYKRVHALAEPFEAQMAAVQSATVAPRTSMTVDMRAGPLRPTGRNQDIAIEGEGFLEISTPSGPAFTRQGSLRVDPEGRLLSSQGLPVVGTAGEIRLANEAFTVLPNGDIRQGDRIAARLKLSYFDKVGQMVATGNGLFLQGGAVSKVADVPGSFRSGFIEGSNVNSPQEMVRLTETVRHFESMQKMVQGYDESLEKAIRKLGEF
jgi:flagellar basal body rod protein FlgG